MRFIRESLIKLADLKSRMKVVQPIVYHELEIIDGHLNPRLNLHEESYMCDEFGYYEISCSNALVTCRLGTSTHTPYALVPATSHLG